MDSGVYLSVGIAGISGVAALTATLYRKYRPLFPVTVNCWFCNINTKVPYGNQTCWDCPHCDQYNGFSQDGDYNKAIPAQYVEDFNYPVTPERPSEGFKTSSNLLCQSCQRNQLLKVKQLSIFEPISETTYDYEASQYKQQLEDTYRLCHWCELNVSDILERQDRKLRRRYSSLNDSLDDSQDSGLQDTSTVPNTSMVVQPRSVRSLRIVAWLISLVYCLVSLCTVLTSGDYYITPGDFLPTPVITMVTMLASNRIILVLGGLLTAVLAIFRAGKYNLNVPDALVSGVWFLGLIISWVAMVTTFPCLFPHLFVSTATVVMSSWFVMSPRFVRRSKIRIRTRRLRSPEVTPLPSPSPPPATSRDIQPAPPVSSNQDNESLPSDDECFSDFETMSLGSPGKRRSRKPDMFSTYTGRHPHIQAATNPVSSTSPAYGPGTNQKPAIKLSMSRRHQPLLAPAKFKPQSPLNGWNTSFGENRPSTSTGLFSRPGFGSSLSSPFSSPFSSPWAGSLHSSPAASIASNDRGSLFSEPRHRPVDHDQVSTHRSGSRCSTRSSVCPVDTTSNNHGNQSQVQEPYTDQRTLPAPTSSWNRTFLALSLLINLTLIFLVMTDKERLLSVIWMILGHAAGLLRQLLHQGVLLCEHGLAELKAWTAVAEV